MYKVAQVEGFRGLYKGINILCKIDCSSFPKESIYILSPQVRTHHFDFLSVFVLGHKTIQFHINFKVETH